MNEQLHRELQRLVGYEVQDQGSTKIGTVHSLWADDTGHNMFVNVKTGWLSGGYHVVPVHTTSVNDKQQVIRVPFTEAKIKDAPSFDENANLLPADEERIYRYYGLQAPARAATETNIEKMKTYTTGTGGMADAAGRAGTAAKGAAAGAAATAGAAFARGKEKFATSETRAGLADREREITPRLRQEATLRQGEERGRELEADLRENEASMKLSEEQLKIGKRDVVVGGMRLHKIIRTEKISQPVELKREKFVVERVPANGKADHEFEAEDVFIPLRKEEAVVEKESHVREEVRIHKEAFTEKETVSGEIRKEDVEIDDKARDPRFAKEGELIAH